MRFSSAIAVSTFLFAFTANAATYYVATTGNDAAAGSISAPFATIAKAAQIAKAGDVVNVRGGVYTGYTSIYSKGTASAPIVFRAMAGETVVLDGTGNASNKPVVALNETEYVDFSGFEVRNSPYIGIVLWHARNTRVLDNHIHHTTRNGIYVGGDVATWSCSDITISGNSVHDTVLENQYHTMTTGGWAGAIVVSKTDRATITNNRIFNNDGEGLISLRSNYAVIRNNEISDNFSAYLYLDNARFATVDRNLIYSTGNTRYYRDGRPGAGISIANETKDVMNPSSDNTIMNNIVVGTRWGFYYGAYESGGGLRNTKVVHNTFHGTTEEIIRVENDTHSNSIVANNIFSQVGSAAPRYTGSGPVVYRNNLWYGGSAGAAAGLADVLANPRFVNAGGRLASDYKLQPGSAAIYAGYETSEVRTDYWGQTRTSSSDIGAHEHSLAAGIGFWAPGEQTPVQPPAALQAVAQSSGAIFVTWEPSADADQYLVYRDDTLVATVAVTSWTDSGLLPSHTYFYSVKAVSGGSTSSASEMVDATTFEARDTEPPALPADIIAVATATQVTLTWSPTKDNVAVIAYAVYRDGTHVATVQTPSWTDNGLSPSTMYTYEVQAQDSSNNFSGRAAATVSTLSAGRSRTAGRRN